MLLPAPSHRITASPNVLYAALSAARAIAELKGFCKNLRDPYLVNDSLTLLESAAICKLSGTIITQQRLHFSRAEWSENRHLAAQTVLNCQSALQLGVARVTYPQIFRAEAAVQAALTLTGMHVRDSYPLASTHPLALELAPLLADINTCINTLEDPLLQAAIVHANVAAHPLTSGEKAPLGLILNAMCLANKDILNVPYLLLGKYLYCNQAEYDQRLKAVVAHHQWVPWFQFFLTGVSQAATDSLAVLRNILQLYDGLRHTNQYENSGGAPQLVRLFFVQPVWLLPELLDTGIGDEATVIAQLEQLLQTGILHQQNKDDETLYIFHPLMRLLQAAADE